MDQHQDGYMQLGFTCVGVARTRCEADLESAPAPAAQLPAAEEQAAAWAGGIEICAAQRDTASSLGLGTTGVAAAASGPSRKAYNFRGPRAESAEPERHGTEE